MSQRVKYIAASGTYVLTKVQRLERVVVNSGPAACTIDLRVGTANDDPFAIIDGSVAGYYPYDIDLNGVNVEVVVTNATVALSASSSSDDILIDAAHGLSNGDRIQFTSLTGGAGLATATTYYVVNATTGTFQLAAAIGGTAINFTTDISAANYQEVADITIVYE